MFFSVTTKNLNWDIFAKNLVTFKRWDEIIRMKNFNIMGVHWKILFLGGFTKRTYRGELPKNGGLDSLQI